MKESGEEVLVVDDDPAMRVSLEAAFRQRRWMAETANGLGDALCKFRNRLHPLVVTDVRMPDGSGLDVMRETRKLAPHTAVILLTAYGDVSEAVEAMRDGACDYRTKPVVFEDLYRVAERVLARTAVNREWREELVGSSAIFRTALEQAQRAAASDADILIQAESGTGKELLARMIHRNSPRAAKSFVAVNCAALPESLLESELFGHIKGAFTGALANRAGKFELANGGTLLLDEIGEMPLSLQPKLLRVLQEREVDRLGATHSVAVDVRVIATTNRSLQELIAEGKFRSDLYYRLNVIPLTLPTLRERSHDIPELAEHFVLLYGPPGPGAPELSPEFLCLLTQHSWPGNVRELSNCIRRTLALSAEQILHTPVFDGLATNGTCSANAASETGLQPGIPLKDLERRLFEMTLESTAGNRSRAAEMLGVSIRTVRNKIRDYGLPPRRSYAQR